MKPSIEAISFNGIEALRLNGPRGASAIISKLGAQVLSWVPPDGKERLFLSDKAVFDGSVAMRGGVPVCFPQFAELGELPKHGLVRTREWSVASRRCGDDYALATLEIADDAETRALWPHAFKAEMTVMLEVDRVYHDVRRPQLLKAGNLSLGIQSQGFPDVVVWNPWVDKCATLADMPADGWRHMLCVEAAIARQPVTLPAGEEWYGRQTLVAV